MAELHVVHTANLSPQVLHAIQDLLHEAFEGDVTVDDFEHALGGMHALVWESDALIAHGAVVMRRLLHDGRALRTGYVEGVAVRSDRRGHGHGAAVMGAIEEVIRAAYELGALASSDEAMDFYARRDWQLWRGTASVLAPGGVQRTEDDEGSIYVLPVTVTLDPHGDLACDWRGGDVW